MTAFYNEPDPFAAQWLENLIAAGHIAPGFVDRRPIQEIEAWELTGYTQCHFFAGIGIWSLALRQAGIPDDTPLWTGSCPCQPFSSAGKQKGFTDERHLWPTWFALIEQRRPAIVLGEQVASKDGLGWLDLVSTDMEASGYAFAAADLCAAGFGQAHLRQRLYFVAVADTACGGQSWSGGRSIDQKQRASQCSMSSGLADTSPEFRDRARSAGPSRGVEYSNSGASCGLEHSNRSGQDKRSSVREQSLRSISDGTIQGSNLRDPGEIDQRWLDADWLLCRNPVGEPSWRPVEPGTFPLAHGVAARMDCLRAYGNALDAETATGFAKVVREILGV